MKRGSIIIFYIEIRSACIIYLIIYQVLKSYKRVNRLELYLNILLIQGISTYFKDLSCQGVNNRSVIFLLYKNSKIYGISLGIILITNSLTSVLSKVSWYIYEYLDNYIYDIVQLVVLECSTIISEIPYNFGILWCIILIHAVKLSLLLIG